MKRQRAFTLIELLVVIVTIALLAALLIPAIINAKRKSDIAYCDNFLKQIGMSFRTWSTDHKDLYPMKAITNQSGSLETITASNMFRVFQAMSNEVNNPFVLACPADTRRPATDFTNLSNANLSYFVGLDADETMPAMLLAGDRNLVTNGVAVGPGLAVLKPSDKIAWSGQMHKFVGNVVLSDGSVQQPTITGIQALLPRTGTNVNRLAIP